LIINVYNAGYNPSVSLERPGFMKFLKRKKLGIVLGALAVLIAAAMIIVPKLLDLNRYNSLITRQVEKALGGKVRLGHISWGIAKGLYIEADGFSISNASIFPLDLELSRIYAEVSPIPLLSKKVVIKELLLEGAIAKIRLEPKPSAPIESVIREKPAPVPVKEPAPLPVQILIEKLKIKKGQAGIEDSLTVPEQKFTRIFKDIEIQATNLIPGEEILFKISLRDDSKPGLGNLTAHGRFSGLTDTLTIKNPELKLTATLAAVSVDAIKPYIKNSELGERLGGNISLTVNYDGDFGEQFRADGVFNLSDFVYVDPSYPDRTLPEAETKLTYKLALSPEALSIEKLTLASGNLSVSAQAKMDNWRTKPVIRNASLTADLPLKEIEPLLPWKQIGKNADQIRSILKQGGRITIENVALPDIDFADLPDNFLTLLPEAKMTARVSGVSGQITSEYPKVENVEGVIHLDNEVIRIEGLTGKVGSANLPKIQATITDILKDPKIEATLKGPLIVGEVTDVKVKKLLAGIGIDKIAGTAELDLALNLETAHPEQFGLQGKIAFRNVNFGSNLNPVSFMGLNADAVLTLDVLDISALSTNVVIPADKTSKGGSFKLEFNGKVNNWRTHPTLNILNVKTSPILLTSLSPAMPWDKLGANAEQIKETLTAGGSISLERLVVSKIDLKQPHRKPASLLAGMNGAIRLKDVTVKVSSLMPNLEGITGRISIRKGVLDANNVKLRLGAATLPSLNMRVTNITNKPKVTAKLQGTIQLGKVDQPDFKKLLERYGLRNLTGEADISLSAKYNQAKPKQWEADGLLVMKGIHAVTHPEGIKMANLQGTVSFNRKNTMAITIKELATKVNDAPIRLEGKITAGGKSKLLIDGKALANRIDLTQFVALAPWLEGLDLRGLLDMDVDVHYTSANPAETRLKGKLKTSGFGIRLAKQSMTFKEANSDIEFIGNGIKVNKLAFQMNDQSVSVEGQITDPKQPNARLFVKTDNLDLDQLMPAPSKKEEELPEDASRPQLQSVGKRKEPPSNKQKTDTKELPSLVRNLTAQLQVEAEKCRFRGKEFQNLKLHADYQHGVFSKYTLDAEYGGGRISTNGSADLRNLERITFSMAPTIKNVSIASIGDLIEGYEPSIEGPFSVTGKLKGISGGALDMLASLHGNLEAESGPGRLTSVGDMGKLISTIFSFLNIRGAIPSILHNDLSSKGIAYQHMEANASLDGGNVRFNTYRFRSSGLNVDARGTINLVDQQLNLKIDIEPLGRVNKILSFVPIAGKTANSFTKIYADVQGPLEEPRIRIRPAETVTKGIEKGAETSGSIVERSVESVGEGVKKIFGR
jgi:uncharacterized protein involved in outer membrane biogenesis